ncbi:MAG: 30S ribosomal protein S17 [bacterium]|nr:30S ribosomal protein S17 [bacterium]
MEQTNDKTQVKHRRLQGVVVSDKMQKTAVVAVTHERKHPKYLKYFKVTTRLKAQNDNNEYKTGDKVTIEETRPLSKEKRWKIISKLTNN